MSQREPAPVPYVLPSMKVLVLLAAILTLSSGCGSSGDDQRRAAPSKPETANVAVPDVKAPWPARLPSHLGAEGSNAVTDAIQVWRLGAVYTTAAPTHPESESGPTGNESEEEDEEDEEGEFVEPSTEVERESATVFQGIDRRSGWLLESPIYVQSAVQFSCSVTAYSNEYRHVKALGDADALVRLQALVVLMKVRAPRTIAKQWQTLQSLTDLPDHPGLSRLLGELQAAFAYPALRADLMRTPPADTYEDDYPQQWAARAAGVDQCWEALPRLRELSTSDNLDTNLAAERSLTEFEGREADEALQHCVLGWQYNAWIHAAGTLLRRNPTLLENTLLEADVPKGSRYQVAVFLGRLGNAAAVPMLCDEVGGVQRIDREMFDLIEALADDRHREVVQALPGKVRKNQLARAEAVRTAVLERLGEDR